MRADKTGPVLGKDRVHALDTVRGFALLGILLSNMAYFASPAIYLKTSAMALWTGPLDKATYIFIDFIATSKFFTLFSFLFGLGFVLFFQRALQRSQRPNLLFLRRIAILLMFGILHAFGIWYSDILLIYAIIAPLLLFNHRQARTILRWAFALLLVPAAFLALGVIAFLTDGGFLPNDEGEAAFAAEMIQQSIAVYGSGTLLEILQQRALDYSFASEGYLLMIPIILSLFLFGVDVAKTERYRNLQAQIPFLKKVWWISLLIGLPLNTVMVYSHTQLESPFSLHMFSSGIGLTIGGPALCFFYMTSIILLCQRQIWARIFSPLNAVGRLALSNYLLQSLVCTTLFYSYGLGFFWASGSVLLAYYRGVTIYSPIILSHFWVKRFRFGPAKWLWRSLTYGKRQPILKSDS